MSASTTTLVLGYVGLLLSVIGSVTAVALMANNPESMMRSNWGRYVNELERFCRFLLMQRSGESIAKLQIIGIALVPPFSFVFDDAIYLLLIPPIALAPYYVLQGRCAERVTRIEEQLDSWLLMLSNALKATPSLGEAINNSAKLMRAPMQEELDLALKENKLGTALDQAVLNMSARIDSPVVSSALATILVGRQTGGDLPRILEESAATLREMARLEGVVRTKTAEGKTQAYVLGVIPFVLIGAIHSVDEHWLEPLGSTTLGYAIIACAAILWLAAIFLARRILAVDV